MSFCGLLAFQGKLNWTLSILVACLGASIGISLSYFIGLQLGTLFFEKYGKYVHMGHNRLEKTSKWFERYGVRSLGIAYFIPGVRHVTGYLSGTTRIPYRKFATYAYLGAFVWTGTFISLGKLLGPKWELMHGAIKKYLIIGSIILALAIVLTIPYKAYKDSIASKLLGIVNYLVARYHSLGKAKAFITCTLVAFLILSYLKNRFLKSSIIFIIIAMLFSLGLSEIYFKLQYPSDIIAGYAFGGVCLSLNIILFELYRLQLQRS